MSASDVQPLVLTEELKRLIDGAFDERAAMVVAAVDPAHKPLVSFRSSLKPYGDRQLCFWARHAGGETLEAIRSNPQVAVLIRSETIPYLQFQGRARVTDDAAERARVYEAAPAPEQAVDPDRAGAAVIVDLDRIEGVMRRGPNGPEWVRMAREGG